MRGRRQVWPKRRARATTTMASRVAEQGPTTLAVLVGRLGGRWAKEMRGEGPPVREVWQQVHAADLDVACGADRVVGLAVVAGWQCVTDVVGIRRRLP